VESAGQVGTDTLQVVVSPLQWNPDWNKCSCVQDNCSTIQPVPSGVIYTMEFRYVSELVVEIMLQVENLANMSHGISAQEFPTIYASFGEDGNPDLPVFLSGNGTVIDIPIPADGSGNVVFESPVPYVAWQDKEQNYGVGMLMDQGFKVFQAWTGDGTNAPYFHDMRTFMEFGIPAFGLGDFPTISAEFDKIIASRPPFGYVDAPAAPYSSTHYYTAGQNISVAGWVLDNTDGTEVKVYVDGEEVATIPVNVPRTDVCLIYPNYGGCPNVGYSGEIATSQLTTSCSHLLHVVAVDSHGNSSPLGDRIFAFN